MAFGQPSAVDSGQRTHSRSTSKPQATCLPLSHKTRRDIISLTGQKQGCPVRRAGSCHCNQMPFEGAKDAQEALTAPSISMMDGTCELCRMGEKESRHSPMAHSSPRWDVQTSTFLEDALLVSTGQAALCPPSRNLSNPVHISCTWTLPIQSSPIRELPNTRDVVPKKALQRQGSTSTDNIHLSKDSRSSPPTQQDTSSIPPPSIHACPVTASPAHSLHHSHSHPLQLKIPSALPGGRASPTSRLHPNTQRKERTNQFGQMG